MIHQELEQMAPEEINKLAESIDKVRSFYGEKDIAKKWDDWGNNYGLSSNYKDLSETVAWFEKDGKKYVLVDNPAMDGGFASTALEVGVFRNPVLAFFLGLIGAFEDPLKGISTTYLPEYLPETTRVPYMEEGEGQDIEVPTEGVSEEDLVEEPKPQIPERLKEEGRDYVDDERILQGIGDRVIEYKKDEEVLPERVYRLNEKACNIVKKEIENLRK